MITQKPRAIIALCVCCLAACDPDDTPGDAVGTIVLSSSYEPLDSGFAWAKQQALAYVFEGDPVGKWYEAALPGREAFCMRDVSHQTTGALALGLAEHTRNMMRKFAENISASRQWTSYWEIDRLDRPAPVDYRSDDDFWYNLPANFDVVQSCRRAYQWTGDRTYLDDPAFDAFYRQSLTAYVDAWDPNGDGLMESPAENGYRGIPTYWEGRGPRALTGGDLVAAQYAANLAYADMLAERDASDGDTFRRAADRLRRLYNDGWWNDDRGRFHTSILEGGAFDTTLIPLLQILPLYFGIVEPGTRRERLLDHLVEGALVEVNVYLAEVYYRSGRHEVAFRHLMRQMDPELERREYPENPFTAVGTIVRYLVGLDPVASESLVETRPRLPDVVEWVQVDHVPVLGNRVGVRQTRNDATRFRNEAGASLRWRAVLPGTHDMLFVDGRRTPATVRLAPGGGAESFVEVDVERGASSTVTTSSPAS